MRLFLQRKDKNIETNKKNNNNILPYFTLSVPPENEDGEWIELAALWKSKKGTGYVGELKADLIISKRPTLNPNDTQVTPVNND